MASTFGASQCCGRVTAGASGLLVGRVVKASESPGNTVGTGCRFRWKVATGEHVSGRRNVGEPKSVSIVELAPASRSEGGDGAEPEAGWATQGPGPAALLREGRNPIVVARSGPGQTCQAAPGEAELMEPQHCGRQGKREEGHGRVRRLLSRGSEWRRYL